MGWSWNNDGINIDGYWWIYPLVKTFTVCCWTWPSRNSGFTHFHSMVMFYSFVNVYQMVLSMIRNDVYNMCMNHLMTGWWFGTFFIFPYIGNNNPIWLIFFRGVGQPPTRWLWYPVLTHTSLHLWRSRTKNHDPWHPTSDVQHWQLWNHDGNNYPLVICYIAIENGHL